MGNITHDPETGAVQVRVDLSAFIDSPIYIKKDAGSGEVLMQETLRDQVRKWAWRLLWQHGAKIARGKPFKYGGVLLAPCEVTVTFYYKDSPTPPDVGKEPERQNSLL